jgi:hypothetical protein
MLLKYYRYILILKLLCLIGGIYYLLHDRYAPHIKGWTVIVSYTQTWLSLQRLKPMLENTPLPWSLIAQQKDWVALHIPWTNDINYVVAYLGAPLPVINSTIDSSIYTRSCKKRIIIQADSVYEETCYYTPYKNILVLLCMLFVMLV